MPAPKLLSTDPRAGQLLSEDPSAGTPMFRAENEKDAAGNPVVRFATELYNKSPIAAGVQAVTGTANALGLTGNGFHPVDALWNLGKDVVRAQWDQAVQAAHKAKEAANGGGALSASEAIGHGMAALLPLIGPAAADVGEHGARGDLAGMAGGALGLLAPFGVKYGLELKNAPNPGKADLLERQATETVAQKVLAPGNPKYKPTAQKIAPEILKRDLSKPIGRFGDARNELLQMAQDGKAEALGRMDAAVNIAPDAPIDLSPIVADLDAEIAKSSVNGKLVPGEEARVKALQTQRDFIASQGQTLPFKDVRTLRQILDKQAEEAGAYAKRGDASFGSIEEAAMRSAASLRRNLAGNRPEVVAPNADFTFWSRLADTLDPTKGRPKQTNHVPSGVTGGMSTTGAVIGAGASKVPVVGPLLGSQILPRLKALVNSPAWELASAQKKMALAEALRKGDVSGARWLITSISELAPRGASGWAATPATASTPDNRPR